MSLLQISVILAMSADGKISDSQRTAARFPSENDKKHLQARLAVADATLFGAATLRAYGTSLPISDPDLLQLRQQRGQPPQPIQIVCSASGQIDPGYRFFSQPFPRWLLTTVSGAQLWQSRSEFHKVMIGPELGSQFDWLSIVDQFSVLGLRRLAVMGGGELVAALVAAGLVDELWLTICPLLLGGRLAPTPMDGAGFQTVLAPRLKLLSVKSEGDEVFLHYRRLSTDGKSKLL